jgi:3'(2'), 5'-bisphosphate nucleotidase
MLAREREVALDAARRAAAEIMRIYAGGFEVDFKGQDDPVTTADKSGNAVIVSALRAAFPGDAIVAEESEVPTGFARHRRCWFVDPLDGTREFVDRVGEFCVMVGLAIDGRAALGVIVVPALSPRPGAAEGYALVGEPGQAFVIDARGDRHPLAPAAVQAPASARIVTSRSRRSPRVDAILAALSSGDERPSELRVGSVGVKVAKILLGEGDGYVHPAGARGGPKLWDVCAPEAIATAAGARFTDEAGHAIDYAASDVAHRGGIVVAGPALHGALLSAIRQTAGIPAD